MCMTFKEFKETDLYKENTKRKFTINGDSKTNGLIEILDKVHGLDNMIVVGTGMCDNEIDIDLVEGEKYMDNLKNSKTEAPKFTDKIDVVDVMNKVSIGGKIANMSSLCYGIGAGVIKGSTTALKSSVIFSSIATVVNVAADIIVDNHIKKMIDVDFNELDDPDLEDDDYFDYDDLDDADDIDDDTVEETENTVTYDSGFKKDDNPLVYSTEHPELYTDDSTEEPDAADDEDHSKTEEE